MDEGRQLKDDRKLFGTLLDSDPARSRSPRAIALAVLLHIVLVVLLIVITKPFAPDLANKLFEQITIIIPEEEPVPFAPPEPAPAPPARTPAPNTPAPSRAPARAPEPEVRFDPTQETIGIPEAQEGPETVEPSDNGGRAGSIADRLRPRTVDPRLSGGSTYALPPDASPAAALNARIASSIGAYNDSVAVEAEAKRRGLDWTLKTKDGKRWGIGPDGKIHLGDITLPKLVAFTPAAGKRDEINARNRDFAEIERQASSEVGRQSFNQRVKAIRARKDKEREEKKRAAEEAAPISRQP